MHGVKVDLRGLDSQPCCQKETNVDCKCHFSCNGTSTMCNEGHMNNVMWVACSTQQTLQTPEMQLHQNSIITGQLQACTQHAIAHKSKYHNQSDTMQHQEDSVLDTQQSRLMVCQMSIAKHRDADNCFV